MGSFANTFLRTLLSWVRVAANGLWGLVTSQEGESLFLWLGRNWLGLAIAICAAGMLADAVVHWFRWRPFEVWKSYFRRKGMTGQKCEGGRQVRRWVYADGSNVEEKLEGAVPMEKQEAANEPAGTMSRTARGARLKLPAFLMEDELAEKPISYRPAPPAKDKSEAFGKPVFPDDWKSNDHKVT